MNEKFDPYTFTSSIEFTGNEVVDDIIAAVLFFVVLLVIADGIVSWQELRFGRFLVKCLSVISVVALTCFLFG